jgi:hypothetical protein
MDTVNLITQVIGSLGFPIVCCGALFWKLVKVDELHKEEMKAITEALDNNTKALTTLTTKLEVRINNECDSN